MSYKNQAKTEEENSSSRVKDFTNRRKCVGRQKKVGRTIVPPGKEVLGPEPCTCQKAWTQRKIF